MSANCLCRRKDCDGQTCETLTGWEAVQLKEEVEMHADDTLYELNELRRSLQ